MRKKHLTYLFVLFFSFLFFWRVGIVSPQTTNFTFIAWGDTKSDLNVLKSLSVQAKALNPVLTTYAGDLESSGFTTAGMNAWKDALNGGVNNGMFDITFPIRGNHDNAVVNSATGWQGFFNLSANAQRIGATNYSALADDLTYSFDYGNSRFIGIDVPGNVTKITPEQINWLDQRLTDAESKNLAHAFFYWHGPIYCQANHCPATVPTELVTVLNKHPVVSAGFFGHEHILTYTHINSSRVPGVTHEFEQIVSGDAGAGPTVPTSGKYDYSLNAGTAGGFVTVSVNGGSFTLNFYKGGTSASQYSKTITKSGYTPPPPGTPTVTPTTPAGATRTPTPTQGTGITRTPTPTGINPNICTFWKN